MYSKPVPSISSTVAASFASGTDTVPVTIGRRVVRFINLSYSRSAIWLHVFADMLCRNVPAATAAWATLNTGPPLSMKPTLDVNATSPVSLTFPSTAYWLTWCFSESPTRIFPTTLVTLLLSYRLLERYIICSSRAPSPTRIECVSISAGERGEGGLGCKSVSFSE
eukprot:gene5760-biopygen5697